MYPISENNKELVFEFFMVFSRFEYALKAARWANAGNNNTAEPDWNEVITKLEGEESAKSKDWECVSDKAGILLTKPPKKQMLKGRRLYWREAGSSGSRSRKLIEAAKRVRNNLFHGAKFEFTERDRCLVTAAREVLIQLLEMPSFGDVREKFY